LDSILNLGDRQQDLEGRALARSAFYRNVPSALPDDPVPSREPQPGALPGGFRREEWLKHAGTDLLGHTHTCVDHLELNVGAWLCIWPPSRGFFINLNVSGPNCECPFQVHGVSRI